VGFGAGAGFGRISLAALRTRFAGGLDSRRCAAREDRKLGDAPRRAGSGGWRQLDDVARAADDAAKSPIDRYVLERRGNLRVELAGDVENETALGGDVPKNPRQRSILHVHGEPAVRERDIERGLRLGKRGYRLAQHGGRQCRPYRSPDQGQNAHECPSAAPSGDPGAMRGIGNSIPF